MKTTDNFSEALALFSEWGGAINYDAGVWMVADVELIDEITTCGAKEATRRALLQGGMDESRVEKIMSEYQN